MKDLHWLKVPQRVTYKLASLTRRCMVKQGPQYLSDYLAPVHSVQARSHLRSASRGDLVIPRSRTVKAGGRGFKVSAPKVWNDLPSSLRDSALSFATFRSKLKTHLFS